MNIMLLSISIWSSDGATMPQETRDFFHMLSALIALPAAAYAGQPFYTSAWTALRQGRLNMDVPITIGVFLALALSVYETRHHALHAYFDSAVDAAGLPAGGAGARSGDATQNRARRPAIWRRSRAKTPCGCNPAEGRKSWALVPVAALAAEDCVLVRSGERIPADGLIEQGASAVDESAITGETLMKPVRAGDMVYAGSINGEGALTLRVTAAGHAALIDEAARLIEAAAPRARATCSSPKGCRAITRRWCI